MYIYYWLTAKPVFYTQQKDDNEFRNLIWNYSDST